jgi:hypothetical protein
MGCKVFTMGTFFPEPTSFHQTNEGYDISQHVNTILPFYQFLRPLCCYWWHPFLLFAAAAYYCGFLWWMRSHGKYSLVTCDEVLISGKPC